jgi:hypothetical protein
MKTETAKLPNVEVGFAHYATAPEEAFLASGCRMALPGEEMLAREYEAQWNLEPGDVIIAKHNFEGQKQVSVFRRVVGEIDCYHNGCWMLEAKECLRIRKPFDLINLTTADIATLEPILQSYSDVFRWSDSSTRGRRRAFRLTAATIVRDRSARS